MRHEEQREGHHDPWTGRNDRNCRHEIPRVL